MSRRSRGRCWMPPAVAVLPGVLLLACSPAVTLSAAELPGGVVAVAPPHPAAAPAAPGPRSLGAWVADDGGVRLLEPPPEEGIAWWLAGGPPLADGRIRARFLHDDRPDYTLLLRASTGATDEELDAYGISVEKDRLVAYRWYRGVVLPMGHEAPSPGLGQRKSVELEVLLVGDRVSVHAYDGETLEAVGSLHFRDGALVSGAVGVRAHARQGPETRLEVLDVEPAGEARTPVETPFGPERLVALRPGAEDQLPAALRAQVVRREADRAWVRTDPAGAERLQRAGLAASVSGDVPWWALDPTYLARMDQPPTPTERGFALRESYKDHLMVEAILRGYAARYPDLARVVEIGRSASGRPILALRITDHPDRDEDEPAILLNAAHHGSELLAIEYALDAVRLLLEGTDDRARRWREALDIWVVPVVSPDANWTFMRVNHHIGRKNGRDTDGDGRAEVWEGVDLNRNYPFQWGTLGEVGSRSWHLHYRYRGPSPASEPEVQAMMALAETYRFVAAISWHTAANMVLSPYTIDGVPNPEPDVAWQVAEPLVAAMPVAHRRRKPTLQRKLYSVDGTDQDWHYHAHGTLAYLVEGSHHNPDDLEVQDRSIASVRPFLEGLLDRVLDGPAVYGHVVDDGDRPVEAEVVVDGITLNAGERWTCRPRDGRFDRLLPGAGTWTVRARTEDGREAVATVKVPEKGRVRAELVLPAAAAPTGGPGALDAVGTPR